jgi:hypothetical protein
VGTQVIENNVDFAAGMGGYDFVHEVEEFAAAATLIVGGLHQSGGYFECREKSGGAVPCVTVAESVHGLPVGQAQIALRPLQSLNRGFLIDSEHQCIRWRIQIKTHYIGGFGTELGIRADAPTPAPLEADIVPPEDAPDLGLTDARQSFG